MDLIEDYIINNAYLREEVKLGLLESDGMVAYAFVGAFFHFNAIPEEDGLNSEEEDAEDDISIDEVMALYHRLTAADLSLITNCSEVMKKFRGSIRVIEANKKLPDEDRKKLIDIVTFICGAIRV